MYPTVIRVIHITWMVIAVSVGIYAGLMGMHLKVKGTRLERWSVRYNRTKHMSAGLSFLTMLFVGAPLGMYSSYLRHGKLFSEFGVLVASIGLMMVFFTAGYYGILLWRYGYDKRRARVHVWLNVFGFLLVLVDLFFAISVLLR